MKKCFSLCLALILSTTIFSGCTSTQMAAGGGGGIVVVGGIVGGVGAFMSGTSDLIKVLKENGVIEEKSTERKETKEQVGDKKISSEKTETETETQQPAVSSQPSAKLEKIIYEQSVSNEQKSVGNNKKIEPTQKIVPAKRNVTYERLTDSVFGFSFDYPAKGAEDIIVGKDLDNKPSPPSSARWHTINFANNSYIEMGSDFCDSMDRLKRLNFAYDFYVNVSVKDIGNNCFLITWTNKRDYVDGIQKSFFGTNNHYGRKEHHYIKYVYKYNTTEEEKQIAQHMIESFQSGFNK